MPDVREIVSGLPRQRVLPPATREQLASTRATLGRPIPTALEAALSITTGLDLSYPLHLTDEGLGQDLADICPYSLSLLGDGFGNSWNLDCDAPPSERFRIVFASHDPPVLFVQGYDLAEFLLFALHIGDYSTAHEQRLLAFKEPGTVIQSGKRRVARHGEVLRCDLTAAQPGDGFWWAGSAGNFAARRVSDGPFFEVWREGD